MASRSIRTRCHCEWGRAKLVTVGATGSGQRAIMTDHWLTPRRDSRRRLITGAGVAALGLATGCTATAIAPAPPRSTAVDDAALLNNVLGLEYEAIAAYDAALAGGALGASDAALARAFQADHAKH